MDFKLYLVKKNGAFIYTNRINWWMELDRISGTIWSMDEVDLDSIFKKKSVIVSIDNFTESNYVQISELCKILSTDISTLSIAESILPDNVIPENINTLVIGENVKMNLDASQHKNLKFINILSYQTFKGKISNSFENLEETIIWHLNEKQFKDIQTISFAKKTKMLQILHTNILSLDGIQHFQNLESIEINRGKSLNDIHNLFDLQNLKKALFINCKKINSIVIANQKINLERLVFGNCNIIPYFNSETIKDFVLYHTKMGNG